ncbi:MAG: hypothetical protein VXZ35_04840, partial [Pseudomonadota bacterium]|nr:hypothetical protein [Pseudomonadota bacterium]
CSTSYTYIEVGRFDSCAITSDGTAICWGRKLDPSSTPPDITLVETAVPAVGLPAVSAIAPADSYTCALGDRYGAVYCWGTDQILSPQWDEIGFERITAGREHFCALQSSSRVECWLKTQMGVSSDDARTRVPEARYTAIAAGHFHTCGLVEHGGHVDSASGARSGVATCWGLSNDQGQLDAPDSLLFSAIAASGVHTCGLLVEDGQAVCWGDDGAGQSNAPEGRFIAIAAGAYHTCALTVDGLAVCWGCRGTGNDQGQCNVPAGQYAAIAAAGAA